MATTTTRTAARTNCAPVEGVRNAGNVDGDERPAARRSCSRKSVATNVGTKSMMPSAISFQALRDVQPICESGSLLRQRKNTIKATRPRSRKIVERATTIKSTPPSGTAKSERISDGTIKNRKTRTSIVCSVRGEKVRREVGQPVVGGVVVIRHLYERGRPALLG